MEATVFLGVGVGLVSCINDWSLQGRFETNLFFEEVCTLTDLKRYEIRGETEFASDFPGPTEDLAGDEVRGDFRNDSSKGKVTINEVVLVTPPNQSQVHSLQSFHFFLFEQFRLLLKHCMRSYLRSNHHFV